MRLIQVFVYLLLVGLGVLILLETINDYEKYGDYGDYTGIILLTQASLYVILQLVFAFVGNKTKEANVAGIVFGIINAVFWVALWVLFYFVLDLDYPEHNTNKSLYHSYLAFAFAGIFGIIGGIQGVRHGIFAQKKLHAGIACRLTQAIFYLLLAFPFAFCSTIDKSLFFLLMSIAVMFVVLSVLQFVFTFVGKKSKGANVCSIAFNSVFALCVIGLFGFIGGIQGVQYLKVHPEGYVPEPKVKKEKKQKAQTPATTNANTSSAATVETDASVDPCLELTRVPTLSLKSKKVMMYALIASYSLLLLLGILFASVPKMGSLFSAIQLCDEIASRAYGITIGVMMVALVPTAGYYFATVAPLTLSKNKKQIIAICSAALSAAMVAVFFVIINVVKVDGIAVKAYFENDDVWFVPVSMVFAAVGLPICYAMLFFRFAPNSIKDVEAKEPSSSRFAEQIKHVFQLIARGLVKMLKAILKFKESRPEIFIFIASFLFTWFAYFTSFIFSIVVIALFVVLVILIFSHLVELSASTVKSGGELTYTDKFGNLITLTAQQYVIDDRRQKVYKDAYGNEYVSENNGKTLHKYNRFD